VRRAKNTILFIDELHTLVGAGGAEGAIDASNVLKPALARGEIQCIGATTLDEYRKYIEKDGALERRFQQIIVNPPSRDETIKILEGLRDRYEAHHRVQIKDEALQAAVELSDRYISARCLPDKAIDVIDEAGARVRLRAMTRPPDLKELDAEIEQLNQEKDAAVAEQDFEKAAHLRDKADKLKKRKEHITREWREKSKEIDGVVDEEVVREVVSKMTGVPLTRIEDNETQRLLKMEKDLQKKVIGQKEALHSIAKAVRKSRAGLKDPKRPIGSFIFAGPTGVGKTLLTKKLAEFMFGDENALVHLDMSEYMEKHNVSRLVGAPPGYVGYEEGGQLTEKIRRRPYSVVLLDEIEKAHPDVWNMLLQIMEEGRLTDNVGRVVDFKNTIVVMTTNLGSGKIAGEARMGFQKPGDEQRSENIKKIVVDELKNSFRPEFLNRLDDVVIFEPLDDEQLKEIINVELEKVTKRLREKNMTLVLTDEAKLFLVHQGSSREFGARPLRRAIEQLVENPLAEALLGGTFKEGDRIEGNTQVWFKLTKQNWYALMNNDLVRDVQAKLEPLSGRAFMTKKELLDELDRILIPDDLNLSAEGTRKLKELVVRYTRERAWVTITPDVLQALHTGENRVPDSVLLRLERHVGEKLAVNEFTDLMDGGVLTRDEWSQYKKVILENAKHPPEDPKIDYTTAGGSSVAELVAAGESR